MLPAIATAELFTDERKTRFAGLMVSVKDFNFLENEWRLDLPSRGAAVAAVAAAAAAPPSSNAAVSDSPSVSVGSLSSELGRLPGRLGVESDVDL